MTLKPKLLLVADTYYPKVDGTLRFMEEFVKRANNFDISLLVPFFKKIKDDKIEKYIKKTNFLEVSNIFQISGYQSLKLSFQNFKKIKSSIKEAEIVFIQGPALISYLSLYYSNKFNKKSIFYTHTISWELFENFFPPLINKMFYKLIKKMSIILYNRSNLILVPYHDLKLQLRKEGIKTAMEVAKLGVDIKLFSPTKDKEKSKKKIGLPNKKIIGFVGRISREKNTNVLFEAFNKLPERNKLELLMVGYGPEDQIKKFKALNNCRITGFVSNVQDYLKAMDILVMPSLTETTSLVTLEAMSCGLPVIASKVGFIKRYLIKNHNGLFFAKNNPTMLALKIEKLLNNDSLRIKLGKNARRMVAYSFSWERSINRIKRLLLKESLDIKENSS